MLVKGIFTLGIYIQYFFRAPSTCILHLYMYSVHELITYLVRVYTGWICLDIPFTFLNFSFVCISTAVNCGDPETPTNSRRCKPYQNHRVDVYI